MVGRNGGAMMEWLDPPNRAVYRDCVLNDPAHPLTQASDPVGIVEPALN